MRGHVESIFAQLKWVVAEQILVLRMVVLAAQKDAWLMLAHVVQRLAVEKLSEDADQMHVAETRDPVMQGRVEVTVNN